MFVKYSFYETSWINNTKVLRFFFLTGHEVVEKLQSSDQVHQLKGEAQQFGKKAQSFQNTLTEEMKKAYEELQKMKNKK